MDASALQAWVGRTEQRTDQFRAVRPLFDIHRFVVCGRPGDERGVQLWACDHEGLLAMEASAQS